MGTTTRIIISAACVSGVIMGVLSPGAHAQQTTVTDIPSASTLPTGEHKQSWIQFSPISDDAMKQFAVGDKDHQNTSPTTVQSTPSSVPPAPRMSFIPTITPSTTPSSSSSKSSGSSSKSSGSSSSKSTTSETLSGEVLPPDITDMDASDLATAPGKDSVDFGSLTVSYSGTTAEKVVQLALEQVGKPYVWGATGPDTFDCSGLIQWSYSQFGVTLPRVSWDQIGGSDQVSVSDIKPGDVVGYSGGDHVAMYIGNGEVVHAPQPGENVKVSPLDMMTVETVTRWAK